MNIESLVRGIITEYQNRQAAAPTKDSKTLLSTSEWDTIAEMLEKLIPPLPRLPTPRIFAWAMGLAVPFSVEVVLIRDGKVFLNKRDFCGDLAYHTPGTYVVKDESFLQAAQRCADREVKVKITSARPISPPVNHPNHPRFHDVSVLFLCEFEGEPQEGEWFGAGDFPRLLKVQQEYEKYIRPYLS